MVIYLAGKMRGVPRHNYPAFDDAAKALRLLGFDVVSPADIARHYGFTEDRPVSLSDLRDLLLADLKALAFCDAIYTLPGYETSKGAAAEIAFAACFEIPIFTSVSDLLTYQKGDAA